jgi:L-fucose mutarotase
MLKHVDPLLSAELLFVLKSMGHGDDLLICDRNHPAASIAKSTIYGKVVPMPGTDLAALTKALLRHFPLDTFVDAPVARMEVVGDPGKLVPAHLDMQAAADAAEGRPVQIRALERFAFYEAARQSFAVVQTSDPGPYGCFLLKMGVI